MARFRGMIWLVSLVAAFGCDSQPQIGENIGSSDDPVIAVQEDDPEMAAAVAEARRTVGEFIAALQNPPDGAGSFAVKKKFVDGEQSEFMWLTSPTYANGEFTGTLDNDPQFITNVTTGSQYSVKETEIEDWLYITGDDMKGGYSVRLLMQRSQGGQ